MNLQQCYNSKNAKPFSTAKSCGLPARHMESEDKSTRTPFPISTTHSHFHLHFQALGKLCFPQMHHTSVLVWSAGNSQVLAALLLDVRLWAAAAAPVQRSLFALCIKLAQVDSFIGGHCWPGLCKLLAEILCLCRSRRAFHTL